jgi:hypothetical protein
MLINSMYFIGVRMPIGKDCYIAASDMVSAALEVIGELTTIKTAWFYGDIHSTQMAVYAVAAATFNFTDFITRKTLSVKFWNTPPIYHTDLLILFWFILFGVPGDGYFSEPVLEKQPEEAVFGNSQPGRFYFQPVLVFIGQDYLDFGHIPPPFKQTVPIVNHKKSFVNSFLG